MQMKEAILSRWRHDHVPGAQSAKFTLDQVLNVSDALAAHRATIAKNDKLSPIGKRDLMRELIGTPEIGGAIYRTRRAVDAMRAALDAQRAKMQPPAPDKADAAGATLRAEMRSMLRGMDAGERVRVLTSEPDFQVAALQASDILSGITPEIRERVLAAYVERVHPGAAARLAEIEEAVEVVNAALGTVTAETARSAEIDRPEKLTEFVDQALGDRRKNIDAQVSGEFATFAVTA